MIKIYIKTMGVVVFLLFIITEKLQSQSIQMQNGNAPDVIRIDGKGAQTRFQLTDLTSDYDIFLLWSSQYYSEASLESLFNSVDKGWNFFYGSSAYISSTDPSIKARSINGGNSNEEFVRYLNNNESYWIVICPKFGAGGSYTFTVNSNNSVADACKIVKTVHSAGSPNYDYSTLEAACTSITDTTKNYTIVLCDNIEPTKTIYWTKSGTKQHRINITCVNGVKIKGTKLNPSNPPAYMPALSISGYFISLDNLEFDEFDGNRVCTMFEISYGGYNTINNCKFSNFTNGSAETAISISNSSNNCIENCTFSNLNRGQRDDKLHAIYIISNSYNNLIKNNIVNYCSGDPFAVKANSKNNTFDGNTIKMSGGPAYFEGEGNSSDNLVKNSTFLGPDPYRGYYGAYIKRFRGGIDNCGKGVFIDDGTNTFTTHDTNLFIDYVIDDDNAKFLFLNYPLIHPSILYNGSYLGTGSSFEGVNIEMTDYSKINGNGAYRNIYFTDNSCKPRKISPIKLVVYSEDISASVCENPTKQDCVINLEKWVVKNGSAPSVFEIIGAGTDNKFQLTGLTADYDIFLLWSSYYYTRTLLEEQFKNPDKGWSFFYNNSAYISSTDPNGAKARGINGGNSNEEFVRYLNNDEQYWVVVCPYNRALSSYKLTVAPANSNRLKSVKSDNLLKNDDSKIVNKKHPIESILINTYPNPFKNSTTIAFSIPTSSHVQIIIYDMFGKIIQTLVNEDKSFGEYRINWNPNNIGSSSIPSGQYIIQMILDKNVETAKVLYMK